MGAVVNGGEEAYCLKWSDFHTSLTSSFLELRAESEMESLLDVTICCEGQAVRAHRIVLSASSGIFRQMFRINGGLVNNKSDPVIMMWDVKAEDLKLLINFMYVGEVNVSQENLTSFLTLAERLQVRGLTTTLNCSRTSIVSTTSADSRRPSTTASSSTSALKRPRTSPHLSDDLSNGETNVINIKQEEQQQPQEASTSLYANATSVPYQFNSSFFENSNQNQNSVSTGGSAVDQNFRENDFTKKPSNIRDDSNVTDAATSNGQTAITTANNNAGFVTEQDVMGTTGVAEYAMTATNPTGVMVDTNQTKGGIVVINTGSNSLTTNVTSGIINVPQSGVGGIAANIATLPPPPQSATSPATATGTAGSSSTSTSSSSVRQIPASSSSSSQSNSGTCIHCNKTFRQLRSHIQDVHCPTPTPCPLCGKMFSSKHKMFGHKYRSCPNRTRNLVRHLQDLDHGHGAGNHQVADAPQHSNPSEVESQLLQQQPPF